MDDSRLHALRQDPPPAFAERLRSRLAQEQNATRSSASWPLRRLAFGAVFVAAVALLFTVPQVRTSAQSFLAMFRTVNFVALPVDPERMATLSSQQLDVPELIGERLEVLEDAGPALTVVSTAQAGAAAGIDVREPSYLPPNHFLGSITVKGQHRGRVTADAERLREVMDLLGIRDLEVPAGLDGAVVSVRIPPVVTLIYELSGRRMISFVQAATPEVSLPSGIDLPALGEIGLRIMGLPPVDAREFAQAIDWQTTLVVPIPPGATGFKQVSINGAQGVMIERAANPATKTSRAAIIVWSADNHVFGLEGSINSAELLQMAQSVR